MKLTAAICLAFALLPTSGRAVQASAAKTDDVVARLETIRAEIQFPALGAALVTFDKIEGVWVAGTRRSGGKELVEKSDRWYLNSCTKPMTATLIALLVARGDLSGDTPLERLFPDIAKDMHEDFRRVTLVELLTHRAGIQEDKSVEALLPAGTDLSRVESRAAVARAALTGPPAFPPGTAFQYSNIGYVVAGHVAEAKTGKTWEALMQELLFEPLGMKSAGFGPPGQPDVCDEPRGHRASGEVIEPSANFSSAAGPAGTVHASLEDWARFAQLHLRGAHGDVKVGKITLTREAFASLREPFDAGSRRYARGWVVKNEPWAGGDGTTLNHNGTNTAWYSEMWLGLENGVAVLVATNGYGPSGRNMPGQVLKLLIEQHEKS